MNHNLTFMTHTLPSLTSSTLLLRWVACMAMLIQNETQNNDDTPLTTETTTTTNHDNNNNNTTMGNTTTTTTETSLLWRERLEDRDWRVHHRAQHHIDPVQSSMRSFLKLMRDITNTNTTTTTTTTSLSSSSSSNMITLTTPNMTPSSNAPVLPHPLTTVSPKLLSTTTVFDMNRIQIVCGPYTSTTTTALAPRLVHVHHYDNKAGQRVVDIVFKEVGEEETK